MASQFNAGVVKVFPRRVITPVTGALALVIGISGGMLFFHLGEGLVKVAHEWLGLLFVAAMLIHILSNWKAFTQHFRQSTARAGVLSVLLLTGVFLGSGAISQPGGPNVIYSALGDAPIASLAVLFKVDESLLIKELGSRGIPVAANDQSIRDAAVLAGMNERDAVKQLVSSVGSMR